MAGTADRAVKAVTEVLHKFTLLAKNLCRGHKKLVPRRNQPLHFAVFGRGVAFHLRGGENKRLVSVNLFLGKLKA